MNNNDTCDLLTLRYKFCDFCEIVETESSIIIFNTTNGEKMLIKKDVYYMIKDYISNYSPLEICKGAFDEQDYAFLKDLFLTLIKKKILTDNVVRIESVDLIITNRCNLCCTHCCATAEGVNGIDMLTKEMIMSLIDGIAEIEPNEVCVTGGEPMLRSDFFEIAEYLRNRLNSTTILMTNGTLINTDNVNEIVKCFDSISISLDGYDEESCKPIRGCGVFNRVMESINLLINSGMDKEKIYVSMVETKFTGQDGIEKFEKLCKNLGIRPMVRALLERGRGLDNKDMLKTDNSMRYITSQKVQKEKDLICKLMSFGGRKCRAGYSRLSINYDGKIYPCNLLTSNEFCLGDIREINLAQYLKTGSYRLKEGYLRLINKEYLHEGCKNCKEKAICFGCLAGYIQKIKGFTEKDSFCPIC